MSEIAFLSHLDALVSGPQAAAWLEEAADRLLRGLEVDRSVAVAFEVVPARVLEPPAPAVSAWVFALRRGRFSGAERHPNSTQRMAALRGAGVFQTWDGGQWQSFPLRPDAGVDGRWISIPPNVWHQAAPPEEHWVVVSFHTVAAQELIEERGDPATQSVAFRLRYLDREK